MITINNTKTLRDLVVNVGREFENRVFVRYERDDSLYEKGYDTFSKDTLAVAAYIETQNEKLSHATHAAILGRCSYEFLTVLLGVPSAGGISIPMDVQLSNEALVTNLKKADVDILFFDREFSSQVEYIQENCPFIKRYVCLQSRKNVRCVPMIHKVYRGETLKSKVSPSDCGIIIFTSGTTGQGKGVMLSHGNVIDNMFCTDDDTEICLNVLPIHHVFCISGDVLLVLRYGSTLCICDDVTKMLYYIQLFQPTMMRVVPMMAKMLVNRVSILRAQNPDESISTVREKVLGKRLRKLTSGGGYLSPALSEALMELGITTAQGYGMSECSPKISAPDYSRRDKLASVGRLVTGCQVRIVDEEIQVKSPSVMMGYYNDPELTKEAITEDGWLRTGDIGYVDDEDFLFLNGRKKNLIILSNGENVSPEMIENKFDSDRIVSEMIAYGAGEQIAAEFYPNYEYAQKMGITDIEEEIRAIVEKHNDELPTYARIAQVNFRNVPFKKNSSRKIVRGAFFEEQNEKAEKKTAARKPETELQKKLFELAAREVGNTDFGIEDNLYECGLDSMGSTMLIADIMNELEKEITLSELLKNNTVCMLEELLLKADDKQKIDLSKREVYPLTTMQMYFAYVIPNNTTGNLPFAFYLPKEIELPKLKQAIYTVLDAHPGLKGMIKPTPNKYYGYYRYDDRIIDIPVEPINDADVQDTMQNLIKPFVYDGVDNLVHIKLFEGQEYNYMFFDVAHLAGDGVSMNILMEDIDKAYRGEKLNAEKDYSIYEYNLEYAARKENGIYESDINLIDSKFKGYRMSRSILAKAKREDLSDGINGVINKRIESFARKELLYYGKNHGVSENAMFIAAYNYCISLFSDEDDIICSSIHSGRTDSRWANIAGALFETYHCRYVKKAHEKVEDYIRRTGNDIMETMQSVTTIARQGEMFFQFQGDILNPPKIGGIQTERVHVKLNSLPFHLQVMYDDKGYYLQLRFWENRFDYDVLNVFLGCFEETLHAILKEETSVRLLKYHYSDEYYPRHYYAEAGMLNASFGRTLIEGVEDDEKIKLYVFDESFKRKPYGAWGKVYIMNYEPVENKGVVQYPYGVGALYDTGLIGRIMPDGTVDFLENAGRMVLTDGSAGRIYYDLKCAENLLMDEKDIEAAACYLAYSREENTLIMHADIKISGEVDTEALLKKLSEGHEKNVVPRVIHIV